MDLSDLLASLLDLCGFIARSAHYILFKASFKTFLLLTQFFSVLPLQLQALFQVIDLWLELIPELVYRSINLVLGGLIEATPVL